MLLWTKLKEKSPQSGPFIQVRAIGVEPTWIAPLDPKFLLKLYLVESLLTLFYLTT